MESGIQSSFIPHDAGQPQKNPRLGGGGLGDLLLVFGIVALAASGALAGAVFLYSQYLQSAATSDLAQIERAKQQFEPALINQLTRFDDRMQVAEQLLNTHVAPSAFFSVLNQVTLKTVSFSSLQFDTGDPHHIQVKMAGIAHSVNSIALQDDLMSQSGVFLSPIFSGIDRKVEGVHFNVSAFINPATLNFVQLTGGAPSQASVIPGSASIASTTVQASPTGTSTTSQ